MKTEIDLFDPVQFAWGLSFVLAKFASPIMKLYFRIERRNEMKKKVFVTGGIIGATAMLAAVIWYGPLGIIDFIKNKFTV